MDKDTELQKFTNLSQGLGVLLYSTKKQGLYKPGLMVIIITTVLNMIIEVKNLNIESKNIPKYIVTIIFSIVIYLIYMLYYRYEDYIHDNNLDGDYYKYSKNISYILITITIMQLIFVYDIKVVNIKDKYLFYALIIYILTLKLILIYTDMHLRLKYVIKDKKSNN